MWNHKQIGLFRLFSSPFSFHVILLNYQETITVIWIRPVVSKTNLSVYNFNGFLPPSLAPREVCCLELFKFGLGVKRSSQPSVKPPITTAALSHSLLMFGPRPVRLLWQQEGGLMFFFFFKSSFILKQFLLNFPECVICSPVGELTTLVIPFHAAFGAGSTPSLTLEN